MKPTTERPKKRPYDAAQSYSKVVPYRLECRRTKPDCVSDIRWRIELRRRQNPEYYHTYGILPNK